MNEWSCPHCGQSPERRGDFLAFAPELDAETDDYDPSRYEALARIEPHNFWFTARNALITRALRRHFPDAKTFLEVGCGTGFVLSEIERQFPQLTLYGSEINSGGLAFAAGRAKRATLFQMDARHIPFRDELDVIGAFDVIEHIEEDEAVLAEMHDAVRAGGGLLLTVPQHPRLWSTHDDVAHHKRRYTRNELVTKVENAGFEVLRTTGFVSLLLPAMLAHRKLFGSRNKKPDTFGAEAGLHVGGVLNGVLSTVMTVERGLTRVASLPFGGSLLLVGRRPAQAP